MSKVIFDNYIENTFGSKGQAKFKINEFLYNYKQYFPLKNEADILDVGIGCGEMLTCFKSAGYTNYIGIDISPSTVEFCKKLDLNCELVDDSISWLDERIGKFSLITLLDVLEHFEIEFSLKFLKSAYEALDDNGILIIQVPNMQSYGGQLLFWGDITHKVGFIENSLAQLLNSAGILNFKIYSYENIVNPTFKNIIKKFLRSILRKWTRFSRTIHGNLNPEILSPVFYAVVRK